MSDATPIPRSRASAFILSIFLPGLSQLYTSQGRKALIVVGCLLFIAAISVSRVVIWLPWLYPLILLNIPVIWLYSLVDGVRNASFPRPRYWYNRWYVYLIALFFVSFVVGLIGETRSAQAFSIPANSMAPAILSGDRILVDRTAYSSHGPRAGDLAVFEFPKDRRVAYIKRIVGVSGDVLQMRDKKFFRNEKEVPTTATPDNLMKKARDLGWFDSSDDYRALTIFEEELGNKHLVAMNMMTLMNADFGPIQVKDGTYFAFGDNRDKSSDSRFWGSVPEDHLIGRPAVVWFSIDPSSYRIRWERIGQRLE